MVIAFPLFTRAGFETHFTSIIKAGTDLTGISDYGYQVQSKYIADFSASGKNRFSTAGIIYCFPPPAFLKKAIPGTVNLAS
jgi:hypothetical protein